MSFGIGARLGHYRVTAKIGEGGMGEVYRARDTTLDRDVALKVFPQAFTDDPDRLARSASPERTVDTHRRLQMFRKCVAPFFTLIVVLALAAPSAAQSADRTMPMRTPDGQPHISGIFTFRTITPFQRPSQFEGREHLSARIGTCSTLRRVRVATNRGRRVASCHTTNSGTSGESS